MGLARAWSVALRGVEGHVVEVEADIGGGLPGVHLVGLPDAALQESRDRVRAAVVNSGRNWPNERVVLALSPATLRKTGSGFDLALACGVLAAAGTVAQRALDGTVLVGELALDGRLRAVRGVLPCLLAARAAGMRRVVVPEATLPEAALVDGVEVHGAATLGQVLAWLEGAPVLARPGPPPAPAGRSDPRPRGRGGAGRRPPGAGGRRRRWAPPAARRATRHREDDARAADRRAPARALLGRARRSPRSVRSRGGCPPRGSPACRRSWRRTTRRRWRRWSAGAAGSPSRARCRWRTAASCSWTRPPSSSAHVLDALRTPLEEGEVRLARADGTVCYPARFQLVLAANPCPCAPAHDRDCVCPSMVRRRYLGRLSGPLLDRVDLRARMYPVTALSAVGEPARTPRRSGPGC